MYSHEEGEENGFEAWAKQLGLDDSEGVSLNLNLPVGETLMVSGVREIPTIISIVRNTQRDPRRDARMLAATLATALDPQTLVFLVENLYHEFIAPTQRALESLKMMNPEEPKAKKPKPKKEAPEEEE